MAFSWQSLMGNTAPWNALDIDGEGRFLAVQVRGGRGRKQPAVLKVAQSETIAMGEQALGDVCKVLGTANWTMPLARGDYQVLVLPEPPVLESEMESNLRWTISTMIDFPVDQAVISWMRIPTEAFDAAKEKQLYVIVARQSVVDEQSKLFGGANATLKAVDIRETALRNIATLVDARQEGIGLVTVGETGVTTTFTFRGELYLDRFIAQPLDEIVGDATRLEKFFDRVAQQVYQSMDQLSRTYPFITIGRILVAPLPQPLAIARHLKDKLQVPVEMLDLSTVLDMSATPELRSPEVQAKYLVALGAALRDQKVAA